MLDLTKINLALSGGNGRMGKAIINSISQHAEFNLNLILTKAAKIDLVESLKKINVLIDFSTPNSCLEYLRICSNLKIPVVIGTTGFNQLQKQEITELAKCIPVLLSPNMSIGINISKYLLALLSKLWSQNYKMLTRVEINEIHHKDKKDAPSGTALMLGEIIKKNFLNEDLSINFNSKRIGKVKGKHQIIFANNFEELLVSHKVKDRKIFAEGALLAAKWLFNNRSNLIPKIYNFSEVIDLENVATTKVLS